MAVSVDDREWVIFLADLDSRRWLGLGSGFSVGVGVGVDELEDGASVLSCSAGPVFSRSGELSLL
jgi:hypothetical protein